MGRPHSVIAQGSTPAPIDHVVNDDKTECSKSRKSLGLSSITHRDGIAKCAKCTKQNTQIKKNIKNAILFESSPLPSRSAIAQGSTPAPIDNVDNDDDDAERSGSGKSLGLSAGGISKRMRLNPSNESNQISQGSIPAPIDHVVNDDNYLKIECLGSCRSLKLLSRTTHRDGIAKCMKENTQNKENAILLESSPLRPRTVIAQGSTPASIDYVNYEQLKRHIQNDINMDNDRKKRYLNMIKKHESRMRTLNDNSDKNEDIE
ncbi:hypothetical protein HCN44_008895 [Aphidius gifuensis]|uniref:Uncharacterized protein n=1 Tax=Aphidius gifuensis TaxID=684658 RepID=A0A834XUK3_APHGI|nr:hypothetical protein HCN44_008895 [Aphidius gifuensis]